MEYGLVYDRRTKYVVTALTSLVFVGIAACVVKALLDIRKVQASNSLKKYYSVKQEWPVPEPDCNPEEDVLEVSIEADDVSEEEEVEKEELIKDQTMTEKFKDANVYSDAWELGYKHLYDGCLHKGYKGTCINYYVLDKIFSDGEENDVTQDISLGLKNCIFEGIAQSNYDDSEVSKDFPWIYCVNHAMEEVYEVYVSTEFGFGELNNDD